MKIRDQRNGEFFWAQNELFDDFLPLIGANGVVVYMAICRMLGDKRWRDGRMSLREIAENSGLSKDTVGRCRADMVALGMIAERVNGPKAPSNFDLLDLKEAALPGPEELKRRLTHSANNQRPTRDQPLATQNPSVSGLKVATDASVSHRDRLNAESQCLRGSPEKPSVSHRDRFAGGATDLSHPGDSCAPQSELFLSTKANTERENARARGEHDVLDLYVLAGRIVAEHPRSQMRNWTPLDVPAGDREAVLEAARADSRLTGGTAEDAALEILDKVRRIAREVPRSQWRFLKEVAPFMRLREYRSEPCDLYRAAPVEAPRRKSEASVGMSQPSQSQDRGESVALNYWRAVRGSARYQAECPSWVRQRLDEESAAAGQATQENTAA